MIAILAMAVFQRIKNKMLLKNNVLQVCVTPNYLRSTFTKEVVSNSSSSPTRLKK